MSTFSCCAYCWKNEAAWDKLLNYKCDGCSKRVHFGCIKSNQPSPLLDDTFFNFKCEGCSEDGKEDFDRMKVSWQDAVALTLYHLQKTNQGRCGFFHWRGHVCAFIDTNWRCLFGLHRKKSNLWMGTVAGVLSSGCPEVFTSGANVVETGFWKLTQLIPPQPYSEKKKSSYSKSKKKEVKEQAIILNPEERRCRKTKDSVLTAAMELKEKKVEAITKGKGRKRSKVVVESEKRKESKKMSDVVSDSDSLCTANAGDASSLSSSATSQELPSSSSCVSISQDEQRESTPSTSRLDFLNAIKVQVEDDTDDLDIDIGTISSFDMPDCRPESPDINSALNLMSNQSYVAGTISGKSPVAVSKNFEGTVVTETNDEEKSKLFASQDLTSDRHAKNSELVEGEEEEDCGSMEDEDDDNDDNEDHSSEEGEESETSEQATMSGAGDIPKRRPGRPRKRRRSSDALPPSPPPRLKRISVFEEKELLSRLNDSAKVRPLKPELAQLRRKLICNQTNREFGLPVFDLDSQLERLTKCDSSENLDHFQGGSFFPKLPSRTSQVKETRDLDRFMMQDTETKGRSRSYTTFHQRLVGLEDHELKPVVSPYTTRVLLPFIWRNYNPSRKPLKLRLLQEIQAYPHRNDSSWTTPPSPPIDFCYVRPEHIPSVNALCREFFWPGIDMSECLQYPDFSCVVLYRKIVIAFAFMVPDRGYNEAYISFIFTHPEWRGAGIATFMLYHLIQTCMGKDVLLHVSTTNPAMLLYQKFGFKAQEFILNFYYKYFPYECKDSTHAVLMRLTR